MPFTFEQTEIKDVILVKPRVFADDRGFFLETFKLTDFASNGINVNFVQSNHSKSTKNVLRGLHFQNNPKAQGKFVSCISGSIFDVAVDIRTGSPTFAKWIGAELSADNHHALYIPEGFAHGFCVLSETAEIIYHCTGEYSPECDRSILWNDPDIGIEWPIKAPILSEKDLKANSLKESDSNFIYNE